MNKLNYLKNLMLLIACFSIFSNAFADTKHSKLIEIVYFKKMGYSVHRTKIGELIRLDAKKNSNDIAVAVTTDVVLTMKIYDRKKIEAEDELKLLRIINKLNSEQDFVTYINEEKIFFYTIGFKNHHYKIFKHQISILENVENTISTEYPELLDLVNL